MMMMIKMMTLMMMMMTMAVMIIIMPMIRMMGRGSRGGLLPSVRGRPSLVSNGMGRGIMPGKFVLMTMMSMVMKMGRGIMPGQLNFKEHMIMKLIIMMILMKMAALIRMIRMMTKVMILIMV